MCHVSVCPVSVMPAYNIYQNAHMSTSSFVLQPHLTCYLTVWGVEPVVTHHTFWLESAGVVCSILLTFLSVMQALSVPWRAASVLRD